MEITINEFPFVSQLPKREKSRYEIFWERLQRTKAELDKHGPCWPVAIAASVLGVSKQRIHQLMDAGQLVRVDVEGHPYIPEESIFEFARTERKAGRPCGPESLGQAVKLVVKGAAQTYRDLKAERKK